MTTYDLGAVLADLRDGGSYRDVAARHGLSKPTIRRIAARHGLNEGRRRGHPQIRDALIEDAEWLADDGANLTHALIRLGGRSADSLWKACKRAGRLDVYERLADREPNGEMRANVRAAIRGRVA